jgi:dTDP-4-amino-4,6-dideoxygalactose transaminase
MDAMLDIAAQYKLVVVEDACQAHGAEYYSNKRQKWCRAGSLGDAAAFSFYPGKNLGACGEGGAITTNSEQVAASCRMLRDHGQSKKYHHEMEGYNGRLDALQAAFLSIKLKHLPTWTAQRQQCAGIYGELLADAGGQVGIPEVSRNGRHVYHLYVVRVADRERVIQQLDAAGVGTGIHYPIPLHLSNAYTHLRYRRGDFPVAERAAAEVLSLPMYPNLQKEAQAYVAAELLRLTAGERLDRLVAAR